MPILYDGISYVDALNRFCLHHGTNEVEEIIEAVMWVSYEGAKIVASMHISFNGDVQDVSQTMIRLYAAGMSPWDVRASLCKGVSKAVLDSAESRNKRNMSSRP